MTTDKWGSVKGRRVVVLGGSSGIGLEVVRLAAHLGAEVTLVSSREERVKTAAAEIGGTAQGMAVDLANEEAVQAFFASFGAFDHLVYTAADSLVVKPLAETDLAASRKMLDLRFWSVLAAVKYASPHLRAGGSITLTTGIYGRRPIKGIPIIASIAAMMEGLTRSLALDLAPLRVNCVSPGVVKTKLWDFMGEAEREEFFAQTGRQLPTGAAGEPEQVAQTYLYLMQQPFSTGQTVIVDGGAVLV